MKRTAKFKSGLTGFEITFTVSRMLNKLKGKAQAPKERAAANELLRGLKMPLPETVELTARQKEALDKELAAIATNPAYLQKWDDVKLHFKKP
jgi:hypothetical protein